MLLLMVFAFIAGAGTAITPCVLPVVPALLARSYTAGLAAVLLVSALAGRTALERIRRAARGHVVERTLGAVLLVTAVVMSLNLDVRFEEVLAKSTSLPAILVNPTRALE